MGYSDQKFYARHPRTAALAASFGTATAAGAAGFTAATVTPLPKLFRRTIINKVRLRCTSAPNAVATALVGQFLNGTDTFATVVLTTATVGQFLDAVIAPLFNTLALDATPTMNRTGTATASGDAAGAYDIIFEEQELNT